MLTPPSTGSTAEIPGTLPRCEDGIRNQMMLQAPIAPSIPKPTCLGSDQTSTTHSTTDQTMATRNIGVLHLPYPHGCFGVRPARSAGSPVTHTIRYAAAQPSAVSATSTVS